jgi:putative glutamine amidotransferase
MERYIRAVARYAEADTLLIPALPDLLDLGSIAARLDGVVLTGSPSNVEPARYGEAAEAAPSDPARDATTLRLIETMTSKGKPVFGICRGFQEINVAMGGTLRRDLGEPGRPLAHHAPPEVTDVPAMFRHRHPVELVPEGALATLYGAAGIEVNSVHFQGVAQLGSGLTVEAKAPDGVIEAFRGSEQPILAVQWHPEWEADGDLQAQQLFALFGRVLRGVRLTAHEPA